MEIASRALALGADFTLLGPDRTMLKAAVPVIAISAVRTGWRHGRRVYRLRSLVDVLLLDGDKVWDPTLRRIDAILDDDTPELDARTKNVLLHQSAVRGPRVRSARRATRSSPAFSSSGWRKPWRRSTAEPLVSHPGLLVVVETVSKETGGDLTHSKAVRP
jgi:hypothetical protein